MTRRAVVAFQPFLFTPNELNTKLFDCWWFIYIIKLPANQTRSRSFVNCSSRVTNKRIHTPPRFGGSITRLVMIFNGLAKHVRSIITKRIDLRKKFVVNCSSGFTARTTPWMNLSVLISLQLYDRKSTRCFSERRRDKARLNTPLWAGWNLFDLSPGDNEIVPFFRCSN